MRQERFFGEGLVGRSGLEKETGESADQLKGKWIFQWNVNKRVMRERATCRPQEPEKKSQNWWLMLVTRFCSLGWNQTESFEQNISFWLSSWWVLTRLKRLHMHRRNGCINQVYFWKPDLTTHPASPACTSVWCVGRLVLYPVNKNRFSWMKITQYTQFILI